MRLQEGGGAIHHSRRGAEDDVAMSRTRLNQRGDDGGVEVEIIQLPVTPGVPSTSPNNWRNRQHRSPQQPQLSPIGGTSPTIQTSPGERVSPPSRSRSALPDNSVMSLAELQQRKRELKQQLKLYDMNFHAQHREMPEIGRRNRSGTFTGGSYNAYKNQISVIEKGETA